VGCDDADGSTARYAARVLKGNLPRFGPFRAVGKGVQPVTDPAPASICWRAHQSGARLALSVRVTCQPLTVEHNPVYAGGMVRVVGVSRSTAHVTLEVTAYSVAEGAAVETFSEDGAGRSISRTFAVLYGIDHALADSILRICSRLLVGQP
jgi:hypothetical protein